VEDYFRRPGIQPAFVSSPNRLRYKEQEGIDIEMERGEGEAKEGFKRSEV
jgi:hypothetical protein